MAPDKVDLAHARLLRDASLQWRFPIYSPPVAPAWLQGFLKWIAGALPHLAVVFWVCLGLGAVLLVAYLAGDRVRGRKATARPPSLLQLGVENWAPTAPAARALLAEADDLARQGRFTEAAHILLIRSVEDIRQRNPRLITPSLTSRDIATMASLPEAARAAFKPIVALVEHGLFGGRQLDDDAFAVCRRAYADFSLPAAWRAQ